MITSRATLRYREWAGAIGGGWYADNLGAQWIAKKVLQANRSTRPAWTMSTARPPARRAADLPTGKTGSLAVARREGFEDRPL
jgi:hypothetical protein